MSTSIAGETIRTTFPNNSVFVDFTDNGNVTSLDVNGDVTVNAPCTNGEYPVDIVTVESLQFNDGDLEPSSGILTGNGAVVNVRTGTIPEICDGEAFQ